MDSDSLAVFFLLILLAIGLELDFFVPVIWLGFLGFYLIQQVLSLNMLFYGTVSKFLFTIQFFFHELRSVFGKP